LAIVGSNLASSACGTSHRMEVDRRRRGCIGARAFGQRRAQFQLGRPEHVGEARVAAFQPRSGWLVPHADDARLLPTIANAVVEREVPRRALPRARGAVERRLQPLGLVLKAGVWYLVAQRRRISRAPYRVSNIIDLAVTEEFVQTAEDIDCAVLGHVITRVRPGRLPFQRDAARDGRAALPSSTCSARRVARAASDGDAAGCGRLAQRHDPD